MDTSNQINVIIIEGVTTTGKSTVFYNLQRYANEHNLNWVFVPESETIIPIIDSTDQKSNNEHFKNLFSKIFYKKADLYVFDRLHLSSIFKTGAGIEDLREIEEMLSNFNTHIFMLYVPEHLLRERIKESMKYRNIQWTKYLLDKVGRDKEKVADLYIDRQNLVQKQMEDSLLKTHILDTSDQNFVRVTRTIIDIINLKPIIS